MAVSLPSKLVRPAATGVIERTELLGRLDAALGGKLIWIAAQAGAGKTSLISSWIQNRGLTALWYQVDAGDVDPATFFHYLGIGAPLLRSGRRRNARAESLPHLTPEYLPGLNVFARRFFESLTAQVTRPAVIVFDDYHEADSSQLLNDIVNTAVDALNPKVVAVVISRQLPPARFARLHADPAMLLLSGEAMKLRQDEAAMIASARGVADPTAVSRIVELSDGWAAGVTLLARSATHANLPGGQFGVAGKASWDYFATEVFVSLDRMSQTTLMQMALARRVTDTIARPLWGQDSVKLLEELHTRQLFVQRSADSFRVYMFHPLFRDFLIARGRIALGDEERKSLCRRIARALEADEQPEDALLQWKSIGEWEEVCRLLAGHAPRLLDQGRTRTVEAWIDEIPCELVEPNGWLRLWRGTARSLSDPAAGRIELEASFDCFDRAGDDLGSLLACGGVLSTYFFARADYRGSLRWMDLAENLYARLEGGLAPEVEATLLRCLGGPMDVGIGHPLWRRGERRAAELMQSTSDPMVLVTCASYGVMYHIISGRFDEAERYQRVLSACVDHDECPPAVRIISGVSACTLAWLQGRHSESNEFIRRSLAIASEHGIGLFESALQAQYALVALSEGDVENAERTWRIGLDACAPHRTTERYHTQASEAGICLIRGDTGRAIALLREAASELRRSNAWFGESTMCVQLGQALMLAGDHGGAGAALRRALQLARGMGSDLIAFHALMALSWSSLDEGDEEAGLTHLRAALALGARRNYMNCHPVWIPKVMARLFEAALEAGIEVPYVQRFIAHRQLSPLSSETPEWPWPIRMHALGRFEVLVGGRPMEQGRKEQRRLLELVKALVACGGESVARQVLVDALWPEGEGDAATHAFDVTLHRLRKALGRDDAVVVAHGQVSLNREVVWVDALAFDRLVDRLERGEAGGEAQERRLIERALGLYRGAFLTAGDDAPLHLAYRQRLRRRYRRMVVLAAQRLAPARAATCLARAIELEPDADEFDAALRAMAVRTPAPVETRPAAASGR